ncbi:hypothetical protein [Streptomyces sp. NRRL B-24085]|uniref:hypothetical protein n=1 Tax=Streptomyces sp. NRRL B-24085 TaxID=1709476 RepID=UPI0035901AC1
MTDAARSSEPQADPAVSVVGPGEGETIALGTTRRRVPEERQPHRARLTPQTDIDAMSRHTPAPA